MLPQNNKSFYSKKVMLPSLWQNFNELNTQCVLGFLVKRDWYDRPGQHRRVNLEIGTSKNSTH